MSNLNLDLNGVAYWQRKHHGIRVELYESSNIGKWIMAYFRDYDMFIKIADRKELTHYPQGALKMIEARVAQWNSLLEEMKRLSLRENA